VGVQRAWYGLATGCLVGAALLSAPAAAEPVPDLRVLIDVSGSMKKNDPTNLRAPALRLLVDLLPRDARAGVWAFGEGVSLAAAPGPADDRWRRRALLAAAQIHSRDPYTDVEQALRAASRDWTAAEPGQRRVILLLTDGLVDLPGDPQRSVASRERILAEVLPQLLRQRATIYTVGLSQASDRDLLERLAVASGGWHEPVDRADQLDRVFLRLFALGTRPDTLPLQANRFVVDDTVEDMTVVVFRASGAAPTALQSPDGTELTATRHPGRVQWRSEPGHDLITVDQPPPGAWRIQAVQDPDNRVLVLTNLRLAVDPLPERATRDDALVVRARLLQGSEPIRQTDLLSLVRFSLEDRGPGPGEGPRVVALADDGVPPDEVAGDGLYSASLGGALAAGVHELAVVARGGSFERESRHLLQVRDSPISAELAWLGGGPQGVHRLTVRADPALVHLDSIQVGAGLAGGGGPEIRVQRVERASWVAEVPGDIQGRDLELHVEGMDPAGFPFRLRRSFTLSPAPEPAPPPGLAPETVVTPAEPTAAPLAPGWGRVALYVGVVHLLIAGVGFGGYRLWARWARVPEEVGIQVPPDLAPSEAQGSEAGEPEPDLAEHGVAFEIPPEGPPAAEPAAT